ncbi:hypothetical protein PSTT_00169 [Puccinia striiformis]|uniref:Uncharacterized protein n=1 Tax=Puccinia striiformis TaxID=27350 RepID=A0A2S4W8H3_9BASI|nr:hypothetical protein PSTT_00169 [Puccinia striiformis]
MYWPSDWEAAQPDDRNVIPSLMVWIYIPAIESERADLTPSSPLPTRVRGNNFYQHSNRGESRLSRDIQTFIPLSWQWCGVTWPPQQAPVQLRDSSPLHQMFVVVAEGSSVDFLLFLIPIIKSLDVNPSIVLKCDNRAAVLVSDDNSSKGRMKSLERNFFFVNDAVREHNIKLDWVSTSSNIADFFTKSLRANLHSISLQKIFI